MKPHNSLLTTIISLMGLTAVSAGTAAAQSVPELNVTIIAPGTIQTEVVEEELYRETLESNIGEVGKFFDTQPLTIAQSQQLVDRLHTIGIGENTQVAQTLCAIETLEIHARKPNLEYMHFHLDTVEELLAENYAPAVAVDDAIDDAHAVNPEAVNLYMQASLLQQGCATPLRISELQAAR
jgi:hypothetical protein